MKNVLIFIACLVLGPTLGCFLSGTWHSGANTFWKSIDYFPYPVKTIIVLSQFGDEFWVETTENETYQIRYPCTESQICWTKADIVPSKPSEEDGSTYDVSENRCKNDNFVYPLPYKITMCITSVILAESPRTSSLVLTDKNKLWIWNKPWVDSFTVMISLISSTIAGGLIGYLAGIIIVAYNPPKRKGKKK